MTLINKYRKAKKRFNHRFSIIHVQSSHGGHKVVREELRPHEYCKPNIKKPWKLPKFLPKNLEKVLKIDPKNLENLENAKKKSVDTLHKYFYIFVLLRWVLLLTSYFLTLVFRESDLSNPSLSLVSSYSTLIFTLALFCTHLQSRTNLVYFSISIS